MIDYAEHIRWVRDNRGVREALTAAIETIVNERTMANAEFHSQFMAKTRRDSGAWFLRQVSETWVSSHFDLADCNDPGDDTEILWVDPATGLMHPVTVGRLERAESDDAGEVPFYYGNADLLANGHVVGSVQYTDH